MKQKKKPRGFFYGKPSEEDQIYDSNTYIRNAVYMGRIEEVYEDGTVGFYQKNKFSVGDTLQVMLPAGDNLEVKVEKLWDESGKEMESAPHPKQRLRTRLSVIDGSDDNSINSINTGMVIRMI